jgi:hypothetical protein
MAAIPDFMDTRPRNKKVGKNPRDTIPHTKRKRNLSMLILLFRVVMVNDEKNNYYHGV